MSPSTGGPRLCSLEKPLLNSAGFVFLDIRNGVTALAQPDGSLQPLSAS